MGLFLLAISVSLLFVVNAMMSPSLPTKVATLPSSDDKLVVENMTSWITNDTIKMYVHAHLLFCPNQDMCFGEEYQRKVSFSKTKVRSCSVCGCNDNCHRKKNCCPWRNYKQNISTSTQFITYVDHSYSSHSRFDTVALDCISPSINLLYKQKYFMVSDCPSSFVDEVTLQKCQKPENETDLKIFQPVTSIKTNETFRNLYCANCNGENSDMLLSWETRLSCRYQDDLMKSISTETLITKLFSNTSQCGVEFIPPLLVANNIRNRCYTNDQYVDRCNITGLWQTYDSQIERGCSLDFVDRYMHCTNKHIARRQEYKNLFCAMCNVGNWASDLPTECIEEYYLDQDHMDSFSAMIDLSKFEENVRDQHPQCPFYDPLLKTCHRPFCDAGLRYENFDCVSAHAQISKQKYEMNIRFTVKPGRIEPITDSLLKIIRYIYLNESVGNLICKVLLFVESDAAETFQSDYSFMLYVEMFNHHFHNYTEILNYLLEYFKFDDVVRNNLNVELLSQSFKSRYHEHTSFSTSYRNPVSGKDLYEFTRTKAPKRTDLCDINFDTLTTVVAPFTICPKILIDKRQTSVVVSGSVLCFVDLDFCMGSSYFKESRDKSKVGVCVDQYFEKLEMALLKQKNSMEKITTLVCLSFSSVGCIGTMVAYFIFDIGKHVHSMNIKALCLTLIFANTVFSVSGLSSSNPIFCQIVGVLNHFLWLSVVMWMLASSFTCFQTFTYTQHQSKGSIRKRFFINMVYSFAFPSCMVLTNMLVSKLLFQDSSYGYSSFNCFISLKDMLLYTFIVPIACMVILNFFMFLLSFREISRKDDTHVELKTKQDRNMLVIFFRLIAISGTTWFFGFLNIMFPNPLFSYLHIILASSQGIFLFFAFGIQLIAKNINPQKRHSLK